MNRFEEAAAALSTAVCLDPNSPQAQSNLGNALARELEAIWQEAEEAYRRAISTAIWPDYPEAHYHLAGVLESQRRFEEAEALYRRAIRNFGLALHRRQ